MCIFNEYTYSLCYDKGVDKKERLVNSELTAAERGVKNDSSRGGNDRDSSKASRFDSVRGRKKG